ncbi:EF-hand domain-containing protein, partial [Mariniblastus sp.]|nr:EF-hand domain-containing protein [Mariniblastus sp.]
MKRITMPLALIVLAILTTHLLAQGRPGGARPNGGQGPGPGAAQQNGPSPQQMAQMLLQNFDRDRNGELNLNELSAAMAALQQRMQQANRGGAGGQGAPGGRGG